MEYESGSDSDCNWHTWYSHKGIGKETGRLGNKRTNGDHPNYSIIKNTKSLGDLRRLAVTQTSVKNHLLMLV